MQARLGWRLVLGEAPVFIKLNYPHIISSSSLALSLVFIDTKLANRKLFSASVKSVSLFTTEEVCHPVNCYNYSDLQ